MRRANFKIGTYVVKNISATLGLKHSKAHYESPPSSAELPQTKDKASTTPVLYSIKPTEEWLGDSTNSASSELLNDNKTKGLNPLLTGMEEYEDNSTLALLMPAQEWIEGVELLGTDNNEGN